MALRRGNLGTTACWTIITQNSNSRHTLRTLLVFSSLTSFSQYSV
jgi:hypothetical protein